MSECTAQIEPLGKEGLLEVVACIGNWRIISQILRSLDVSLDSWLEFWAPDGRGPA